MSGRESCVCKEKRFPDEKELRDIAEDLAMLGKYLIKYLAEPLIGSSCDIWIFFFLAVLVYLGRRWSMVCGQVLRRHLAAGWWLGWQLGWQWGALANWHQQFRLP